MKRVRKSSLPKACGEKGGERGPPSLAADGRMKAALAIFLLALAVRIVYLYESADNPIFSAPIIDSNYYDRSANDLIQKGVLSDQFFFQGFFYPLFLAAVYGLTGSSMLWAKIFQAVLGAATCALTCLLGKKAFNRKIGVIAGVFASLYAPLFFFGGELLPSVWAAFWSVCLLLLLLRTEETGAFSHCFFLGACMGLSVLTRPTFLPFCALACAWLAWKWAVQKKERLRSAGRLATLGLGLLITFAPVGVISKKETGAFAVLPTSGAVNLYVGNNPDTDRTIALRPGIRFDAMRNLAFREGVITNTEQERNRYLYGKVISYALEEPVSFLRGLLSKTLQFVCSRELPNNLDIYLFRDWSALLSVLAWKVGGFGFPFGLLFPLALAGSIFSWKRTPLPLLLFPVAYALAVILVHVNSRYRVPVIPVLCIFAAVGWVQFLAVMRRKETSMLLVNAGIVVTALLLAVLPGPFVQERVNFRAETYHLIGEYQLMRNHPEEAFRALSLAIHFDQENAEAQTSMGVLLESLGRGREAIPFYLEAVRLRPDQFDALNNLGNLLSGQGRPKEALAYLERALESSPDARRWAEVQVNIGMALARAGRLQESEARYREALRVTPELPEAHINLGIMLAGQGRTEEAMNHYFKALVLDPNSAMAHYNLAVALEGMGNHEGAVKHFSEALRLAPK